MLDCSFYVSQKDFLEKLDSDPLNRGFVYAGDNLAP